MTLPLLGAVAPAAQAVEAPPYLHPCLDTSTKLPQFVYRGVGLNLRSDKTDGNAPEEGWRAEGVDPETIFRDGFTAKGAAVGVSDYSVPRHVTGDSASGHSTTNSGYVSTTSEMSVAKRFAALHSGFSQVGTDDGPSTAEKTGWVYVIRPDRRFFDISSQYQNVPSSALGEYEWAAVGKIPGSFIVSATKVTQKFVRTANGMEASGAMQMLETVPNRSAVDPPRDSLPGLLEFGWGPQARVVVIAPQAADREACLKKPPTEEPSCPAKPTTAAAAVPGAVRSLALAGTTGAVTRTASTDPPSGGGTTPAAAPGTSGGSPRPLDGATYQLTASASAYSPTFNLDVRGGVPSSGTAVQAFSRNCTVSQDWRLREVSTGLFALESALAPGLVLQQDPYSHNTTVSSLRNDAAGRPNGSADQQWTFKNADDGGFSLVSAADQQCLTMAGQQSTGLGARPCDGGVAQKWNLSVPCAPADPVVPGAGRTVPGYQGLPWPTVKGHPELTWPALPGGNTGGGGGSQPDNCGSQPQGAEQRGGWMWKGWNLCRGAAITSGNADQWTTLQMKGDGTLELVYSWVSDWTGQTSSAVAWTAPGSTGCGRRATMQQDGNFVVYGDGGRVCWGSGTEGHTAAWLEVNPSGTLTIWWVDDRALAAAGIPLNLAQASLDLILALAASIPRLQWQQGVQHRIPTPNCQKIQCT
ncbi:RICIN domain-containing protein [Kitasatospora sp. NPDC052868]|uniref:RICIN domain-containing protein n=1 Tax=Kitasatospora sp. NPDC052868 TaxID=3364060 RepID=UPI0037CB528E